MKWQTAKLKAIAMRKADIAMSFVADSVPKVLWKRV
jgi:hypothetical protein